MPEDSTTSDGDAAPSPRRKARAKPQSAPRIDPYCLFDDDEKRRLALRFKEVCRLGCVLILGVVVIWTHADARLVFGGGLVGMVVRLWRS